MCPQPPRATDDGYLVDELLLALSLMDPNTPELGFSGGEPTLLGARFCELITAATTLLPRTALHVLSNGRAFAKLGNAQDLVEAKHPDLVVGIPLYADIASAHDFVVQTKGAFNETVLGLLNLGRLGARIELRVVLHRETYSRLPHLARFIARSLPFVEQVAFMGLEFMGYAKSNADALWIDPRAYTPQLEAAIETIETAGIRPLIFNLPLCLLPEQLWRFAQQSISVWKNEFPGTCEPCPMRSACCGCFDSSLRWYGPLLRPPAPAAQSAQ
jgi:His-Xaa-Ser system radical SAM maturase HxsC